MEERELKTFTEHLMWKHGLTQNGWTFGYGRGKKTFGTCSYGKKEIRISRHLAKVNTKERVQMTILHEIAHALVGGSNGHNYVWKRKCIDIGGNGERCFNSGNTTTIETTTRTRRPLKVATIHHKEFKEGDKIKFRNCSSISEGEFVEYRPNNRKYPVMVRFNRTVYKMSTRSVIG